MESVELQSEVVNLLPPAFRERPSTTQECNFDQGSPFSPIQSRPATWIRSPEPVEAPVLVGPFEPFVDEHVIARFLQIAPRRVLEMARKKELPSHPIGRTRKTWRFRLSEIDAHFSAPKKQSHATMPVEVPGTQERKRLG